MIKTKRGLLLVALLTFGIAVVVMLPARVAYQWVAPAGVAVSGMHGTAWRGGADAVSVNGIYVGDVSWKMHPWRLLTGQANYRVQGSPVSGFVEANIGIGATGTVTVSDLAASLPLSMFAQSLNVRGLQGDTSLQFERIRLKDGVPLAADGTVRVSQLIAPRLSRDSIGGFEAEFFTQDTGIAATIEDTDGVIDLAGSLEVNQDRSYRFLGKVVAKQGAPASLTRQLEFLGSADERGQREVRFEGAL